MPSLYPFAVAPAPRQPHPTFGAASTLSSNAILELAARLPTLTASLFAPTHPAGSGHPSTHDNIKNLLSEARDLLAWASAPQRADAILAPATRLLAAPRSGPYPPAGAALFCTDKGMHPVWLAAAPSTQVVVNDRCHLKPLLPLLQGEGQFHLLDLAAHGVCLYTGSRFSLAPIELSDAPTADRHFGTSGEDDEKEHLRHFFRRIDAYLCNLLFTTERMPLIIVGVEYLLPLYREVSRYPQLLQTGLPLNTDLLTTDELHQRAWDVVGPQFQLADRAVYARYEHLRGSHLVAHRLALVLRALFQGRVETLFVASGRERWGTYDVRNDKLHEHHPRLCQDDDLLNIAIIQGLASHAHVQVLPVAEMPEHSDIAALLRF